ncbi:MAG: CoA pyrophosphatase [Gemmatimonadaceae bacterium]
MPDVVPSHPWVQRIHQVLVASPGREVATDGSPARAAVALVFREAGEDVELLLIRRAERSGDPWSGQIALPGGRFDPTDASLFDTAVRETWEETAVDLQSLGVPLGVLDELHPRTPVLPPIIIRPYVFALTADPTIEPSHEVAEAFWVGLSTLRDPAVSRESVVHPRGDPWRVPSFVVREHIVWGLTERILRGLLARLD